AAAVSSPLSKERAAMNCSEPRLVGARASTARCTSSASLKRSAPCRAAASAIRSPTVFASGAVAMTLYTKRSGPPAPIRDATHHQQCSRRQRQRAGLCNARCRCARRAGEAIEEAGEDLATAFVDEESAEPGQRRRERRDPAGVEDIGIVLLEKSHREEWVGREHAQAVVATLHAHGRVIVENVDVDLTATAAAHDEVLIADASCEFRSPAVIDELAVGIAVIAIAQPVVEGNMAAEGF